MKTDTAPVGRGRAPAVDRSAIEGEFRDHERMLWRLAYRLTGVAADADEIVQETFLRALERSRAPGPWRPWLVRVATNLGLDRLRARRRRGYSQTWLPAPVETRPALPEPATDPRREAAARYEELESVSYAFLLALEVLTPRARAVLILSEGFDYSAREVAEALGTSEENVRLLHHRARRRIAGCEPKPPAAEVRERNRRALEEFLACLARQDVAGVERLLADSVRSLADGGGEYTALRAPVVGRSRVASFHLKTAAYRAGRSRVAIREVNGMPAALIESVTIRPRQGPRVVLRCEIDEDGRIRELHSILAPRKLTAVRFDRL